MRLGFYYSQAQDWNNGGSIMGKKWNEAQSDDMDGYIDKVAVPQVRELLSNYGPVSVFWWDTPANMNPSRAQKLYDTVMALQPQTIQNSRLGGGYPGDFETPEQYIPPRGIPGKDWETCMTMGKGWGYRTSDTVYLSTGTLIRNLVNIMRAKIAPSISEWQLFAE